MRYFLQHLKPQLILGYIIGLYFLLSFLRLLYFIRF